MHKVSSEEINDFPFKLNCIPEEVSLQLKYLWEHGFVKIKNVLTYDDIKTIRKRFNKDLKNPLCWSKRWTDFPKTKYFLPSFGDDDAIMLSNLIGRYSEIDIIFDKLFNNKNIKLLLSSIMGDGYKLWETSIRRSLHKDKGLSLHQDAAGELGISILLNDHFVQHGTTSIIPKSHRFNINCRESGAEKYIRPFFMKYFSKALVGNAGDIFIFFKRTWHGRIKSYQRFNSDTILMGLFPVGYKFKPFNVPRSSLNSLSKELNRLLKINSDDEDSKNFKYDRLIDYIYKKEFQRSSFWNYFQKSKPIFEIARKIKKTFNG